MPCTANYSCPYTLHSQPPVGQIEVFAIAPITEHTFWHTYHLKLNRALTPKNSTYSTFTAITRLISQFCQLKIIKIIKIYFFAFTFAVGKYNICILYPIAPCRVYKPLHLDLTSDFKNFSFYILRKISKDFEYHASVLRLTQLQILITENLNFCGG